MKEYGLYPYLGEEQYIFVGYCHKNKAEVSRILGPMMEEGYRIWFDEGVAPGAKYTEEIAKKIQGCELFIGFLSAEFFQSEYCVDEITYAREKNKTILLVYLEKVSLPDGLDMRLGRMEAIHRYEYDQEELFQLRVNQTKGIQACCPGLSVNAYSGYGVYTSPEGVHFEGEWKNGKYHGQGTISWPDGRRYDGEWKEGRFHGRGTFVFADKRLYRSDWVNGQRTGRGTLIWPDGRVYDGLWIAGKQSGRGTMTWPDGRRYEGEWKEGHRTGFGRMKWPDGRVYDGNWTAGKQNGHGKMTWRDRRTYDGEWKEGHRTGRGKMFWPDGVIYDGEWKDGKQHGQGREMVSGYISEGSFAEGKKHGRFLEYSAVCPEKKQMVEYRKGDRV